MRHCHAPSRRAAALLLTAFAFACSEGGGTTDPPTTGTVSGRVTAGTANVPGATLTLSQGNTSRTATSSNSGNYTFASVAAGAWTVALTPPTGFELATGQAGSVQVNVTAGQTATANFLLEGTTTGGNVVEVELIGMTFVPADVTIAPGTTIRWIYRNGGPHTVTPDGHSAWSSTTLNAPSQTFDHTFESGGTFAYYCDPHRTSGMTGVIRVQ